MLHPRPLVLALLVLGSALVGPVKPHEESGKWSCESESEARVPAQYRPGVVTLDGHADDWKDVNGFDFSLLPALDPDAENAYTDGRMTVKALHDGKDMYFMMQVEGDYVYSKGNGNKCPSVALMFQVGDNASYHNMGGCKESPGTCTSKSCHGYEVDIMHFSIGNAVPGRLYGGNTLDNAEGYGGDRYGHLVDVYAWNPHCRNLDGMGPSGNDSSAQNDWKGAWWHDSFTTHSGFVEGDSPYATSGQKGTYYFEFSRPLRTMDHLQQRSSKEPMVLLLYSTQLMRKEVTLFSQKMTKYMLARWPNCACEYRHCHTGCMLPQKQNKVLNLDHASHEIQDVQFSIGQSSKFSAAFWYPVDGNPWHGSGHFTVGCDWVLLDISSGSSALLKTASENSWDAASAFALLLSLVSLCLSGYVVYRATNQNRNKDYSELEMTEGGNK